MKRILLTILLCVSVNSYAAIQHFLVTQRSYIEYGCGTSSSTSDQQNNLATQIQAKLDELHAKHIEYIMTHTENCYTYETVWYDDGKS